LCVNPNLGPHLGLMNLCDLEDPTWPAEV